MGFASFVGRVCFASIFVLSAWQMFNDFGVDGGPAAKELAPKLNLAKKHLSSQFHIMYLLVSTPILHDFYNYGSDEPGYNILLGDFLQCVAQCGALIFFWGMKNSITKRRKKKAPKSKTA
ncbi:hypothetical protein E1A91_A01G026600v1 [Gossypium mustelinum]|uniref:Uncharacterized protein n=1 Tax=Gossypium mustelinum TaxID=34275 RepID=A0A5D3AAU0_GOSMU|nr:hypothetical protein E1A91_A01G026600v1 [Gossypium mustelinum]